MSTTQTRLDAYLAAEAQILAGQSVRLGERMLTRADLAEVRRGIAELQGKLQRERLAAKGRGSLSHSSVVFCGNRSEDW